MDRRRAKRYPVENLFGSILMKSDATVLNVSMTGIEIEATAGLRIGRSCAVTFGDGRDAVRLTGTVVRCLLQQTRRNQRGEIEPVYHAGIRFDGVLSHPAEQLMNFIKANARIDMDRRLFGRFALLKDGPVTLGTSHELLVRTLSLTGVRVETNIGPTPGAVVDLEVALGDNSGMHTRARVVASAAAPPGQAEVEDSFFVDLEFVDMPSSDRGRLDRFITEAFAPPS
jgi:hypothetical protein